MRHTALVRATHWLTFVAFVALLVTGLEIVVSHPRFYWGETGNVNMRPLFTIPIPSSRDTVPTGYNYVMPDQNGWSRYLHFQSAWLLVLTGAVYLIWGLGSGHFRKNLWPQAGERNWRAYASRFRLKAGRGAGDEDQQSYNVVQRSAYLAVIFVLFPLVIWTGLALSPGFNAAFPWAVNLLGGRQTARTLHFFVTIALVVFFLVHVAMVVLMKGFWNRMRGMITGRIEERKESL